MPVICSWVIADVLTYVCKALVKAQDYFGISFVIAL